MRSMSRPGKAATRKSTGGFPPFARGRACRERGSAVYELIVITPIVLLLLATFWDVRAFTAYRTDLARELYVVAEVIAGGTDEDSHVGRWVGDPLLPGREVEQVMAAAADRLARGSAGAMQVAVVTRGATRPGGTACPAFDPELPGTWCPPMVSRVSTVVEWGSDADAGVCRGPAPDLPAVGTSFPAGDPVLPHEGDGVPEEEWISRRMSGDDWWVVVDSCSRFGRGTSPLLLGALWEPLWELIPGLDGALDVSWTIRRRAAWGGEWFSPLGECGWCRLTP